jgi:hypothetical protein
MARRKSKSAVAEAKGLARPRKAARDRARLLDFFLEHPDEVLGNVMLRAVLGDVRTDSWTRRLRELREPRHGGYTVQSHLDRGDLRPGQYVFPAQPRRLPVRGPRISARVRGEVLHRDAQTCQACGLARGQTYPDGRRVALHVAHNLADSHGGRPDVNNCFTLCARCNEAESNIGPDRPALSKVMEQVRRLPNHEKQEILAYLKSVLER